MKNLLKITLFMSLLFVGIGCGSEECATCTVTQVITQDGMEVGRQTLNTNQEFCGDALDQIKATEATITQEVGDLTQVVTTTVDCK